MASYNATRVVSGTGVTVKSTGQRLSAGGASAGSRTPVSSSSSNRSSSGSSSYRPTPSAPTSQPSYSATYAGQTGTYNPNTNTFTSSSGQQYSTAMAQRTTTTAPSTPLGQTSYKPLGPSSKTISSGTRTIQIAPSTLQSNASAQTVVSSIERQSSTSAPTQPSTTKSIAPTTINKPASTSQPSRISYSSLLSSGPLPSAYAQPTSQDNVSSAFGPAKVSRLQDRLPANELFKPTLRNNTTSLSLIDTRQSRWEPSLTERGIISLEGFQTKAGIGIEKQVSKIPGLGNVSAQQKDLLNSIYSQQTSATQGDIDAYAKTLQNQINAGTLTVSEAEAKLSSYATTKETDVNAYLSSPAFQKQTTEQLYGVKGAMAKDILVGGITALAGIPAAPLKLFQSYKNDFTSGRIATEYAKAQTQPKAPLPKQIPANLQFLTPQELAKAQTHVMGPRAELVMIGQVGLTTLLTWGISKGVTKGVDLTFGKKFEVTKATGEVSSIDVGGTRAIVLEKETSVGRFKQAPQQAETITIAGNRIVANINENGLLIQKGPFTETLGLPKPGTTPSVVDFMNIKKQTSNIIAKGKEAPVKVSQQIPKTDIFDISQYSPIKGKITSTNILQEETFARNQVTGQNVKVDTAITKVKKDFAGLTTKTQSGTNAFDFSSGKIIDFTEPPKVAAKPSKFSQYSKQFSNALTGGVKRFGSTVDNLINRNNLVVRRGYGSPEPIPASRQIALKNIDAQRDATLPTVQKATTETEGAGISSGGNFGQGFKGYSPQQAVLIKQTTDEVIFQKPQTPILGVKQVLNKDYALPAFDTRSMSPQSRTISGLTTGRLYAPTTQSGNINKPTIKTETKPSTGIIPVTDVFFKQAVYVDTLPKVTPAVAQTPIVDTGIKPAQDTFTSGFTGYVPPTSSVGLTMPPFAAPFMMSGGLQDWGSRSAPIRRKKHKLKYQASFTAKMLNITAPKATRGVKGTKLYSGQEIRAVVQKRGSQRNYTPAGFNLGGFGKQKKSKRFPPM